MYAKTLNWYAWCTMLKVVLPDDSADTPRSGRAADIRAALQDDIESGALPPGTVLDERALAARFEVSRTPVREALQQLAARELVRIAPRAGVTVARLSIAKVRSMLEFISELEALAARLAARRMDAEHQAELRTALQLGAQAVQAGDTTAYAAANARFHDAIYAGCRNPYLAEQIVQARRMIQRFRLRDLKTQAQISSSQADHEVIAGAVLAGDEAAAHAAMLAHLPAGSSGFSEFLAKVPMHFFESEGGDA